MTITSVDIQRISGMDRAAQLEEIGRLQGVRSLAARAGEGFPAYHEEHASGPWRHLPAKASGRGVRVIAPFLVVFGALAMGLGWALVKGQ